MIRDCHTDSVDSVRGVKVGLVDCYVSVVILGHSPITDLGNQRKSEIKVIEDHSDLNLLFLFLCIVPYESTISTYSF